MTSMVTQKRASGILAHITSLPSPYGIGDIGPSSWSFLNFLAESGQKYWQILPTGPTSLIFDSSPYMSSSAFAGSSLLISPQLLAESRLLESSELQPAAHFSPYLADFPAVAAFKQKTSQARFHALPESSPDRLPAVLRTDGLAR